MQIDKIVLIILDSVGVGELPDAALYGDEGSNTLANIAKAVGGCYLPNMQRYGLGNIIKIEGVPGLSYPEGAYGKMSQKAIGKDTTSGHWELAGQVLNEPFPTYPNGFPEEIISKFEKQIGTAILGNYAASGTEIIKELGNEHLKTKRPIVYTSADSVFQIAAHETIIPVERLYQYCKIARKILTPPHGVGRVIARPFIGAPNAFERTANRRDFSLEPPYPTVLDSLKEKGMEVIGIGKIRDIYAGRGLTKSQPTKNNADGMEQTVNWLNKAEKGLVFTNLVDFDMKYGHRNDPWGYAKALEAFDRFLPKIIAELGKRDLLIITADHGCDPTTEGTDHSREYVPLLIIGNMVKKNTDLGIRNTFADVGATIAGMFEVTPPPYGVDMTKEII